MKASINIYRTIKGVRFKQYTSDPSDFERAKEMCKKTGRKYRIVRGEFLIESL